MAGENTGLPMNHRKNVTVKSTPIVKRYRRLILESPTDNTIFQYAPITANNGIIIEEKMIK